MSEYDPFDLTSPQANGPQVITYPLIDYGDTTHIVVTQEYFVLAEDYTPPTLNTSMTVNATTVYLVDDTTPQKADAGLVVYTRRWSSIPATHYEPTSFAATLPGLEDVRNSLPFAMNGRIKTEFFLVGSGLTYTTFDAIPIVQASTAYGSGGSSAGQLPLFGGGFFLDTTTVPTAATYLTAVTTDAGTATSYTYKATASELTRYAGNIWMRKYTEVKAL